MKKIMIFFEKEKSFFGYIKTTIGNFLLMVLALVIFAILCVWGIPELIIVSFFRKRLWKGLAKFSELFKVMAYLIDVLGNYIIQIPSNRLLITEDGYPFGYWRNTYSFVLGRNIQNGTLTPFGEKVASFVDYMFGEYHCVDATDVEYEIPLKN